MQWNNEEVKETLRMVQSESFDIRTLTMGISLRDLASDNIEKLCNKIYDKITFTASKLVSVAEELENKYAIPIINKRVSVTPIAIVGESTNASSFVPIAVALDRAADRIGIDYLGGFSALVQKGMTKGDLTLINSIPEALSQTKHICSSVNAATTKTGINMDAISLIAKRIKELAIKSKNGIGCAKFVVFANAPDDNPFIAGAFHGLGETDVVINVGVSGPGVVRAALKRSFDNGEIETFADISEVIKRIAFKITRAGELVGKEAAKMLGVKYGCIDLSLAPTPADGDSIADILEIMGLERTGTHGTTAALSLLTDAVKKGGAMASSHVGGLSGAFIPVSEDMGMVRAVQEKALSLDKLEAMTSVCSVGLDMIAVPWDTRESTIAGIIADELAIGVVNQKTTAVRILPIPNTKPGDLVDFGGLLGIAPVMEVNKFSCEKFVSKKGQIPAPINSLRN